MPPDSRIVGYQSNERKHTALKIVYVVSTLFLGLTTATQHFAHQAGFAAVLGPNLYRVYFPGMIAVWTRRWFDVYPDELRTSISYGMAASSILLLSFLIASRFVVQSAKGNDKLHGTAHWATHKEIEETGLIGNSDGVYVGAWEDKKGNIHYLRDNGPSHVLCFAPTRSGKGVGLVLPTLLSWKHSTVVSDLKGELWQLTAGWRKLYAGNLVFRFEPGSPEGSARWNPLDEIRMGTGEETGDIRNLTETIIDYKGKGLEDFWQQSAANLLEAIITHVLYKRQRDRTPANMQTIAYFLTDPDRPGVSLEEKFKEMIAYKHYENGKTHKLVASMGNAMLAKPENERGSVISTMDSALGVYKDACQM